MDALQVINTAEPERINVHNIILMLNLSRLSLRSSAFWYNKLGKIAHCNNGDVFV